MESKDNGTKTYKWVIGILVAILLSIASFTLGGQVITTTVHENIRRIDKNDIRIETVVENISEIKSSISKQNEKLDNIYKYLINTEK